MPNHALLLGALPAGTLPITDPVLVFALLMLILLVAPALSARVRLPGVVGLIAAGALVGPSALGLLDPERVPILETLRTLGLLYLMFLAGLSLDFAQFTALRTRSLGYGLTSFVAPQTLAVVLGLNLLDMSWLAALLLGSICGTHTLVALPVAQRLGLGRHPAVTVVAGATLVCDGLGLTVLAAVAAAMAGQIGLSFWVVFGAKLLAFVGGVVVVLPRVGRWVFRRVPLQPAGELTFLLLVLFGTAWLASLAGLAPIVGAFLAGLALNRMVPSASGIMGRVAFVGDALFVPFFLVGVGLLVDFGVLAKSGQVWWLAAVFVTIVLVGKGAAALGAARLFGHSAHGGWLMVGLSSPQAAGTLAVTFVGLDLGLFDATAVNAVVLLILVTCLFGPWLTDRAGRKVALEEESAAHADEGAGRILIPLANPATAGALVDIAILLRDEGAQDPIHPLTVVRDGRGVEEQVARNERMLGEAVLHAVAAGAPVQPATRVDLNPVHGIVRAAKELRSSIVVIGWSGVASAGDRIFGSVLDQLLDQCQQMVIVCKTAAAINGTERVVLITPPLADREEGFERAAHAVKALSKSLDAELVVLSHAADRDRVDARLRATRPATAYSVQPLQGFEALEDELTTRSYLAGLIKEHDLLVVLAARRDTLAWRPELARLPAHLSTAFPGHSLLALHPAQAAAEGETSAVEEVSTPSELHPAIKPRPLAGSGTGRRPRLAVAAAAATPTEPLAAFVRGLLAPSLPDAAAAHELTARLLQIAREHPAEVRPGALFLHAHAPLWDEPRIFVGRCPEPLPAPGVAHPVLTVVALVSPEGQTPEQHLQNLAVVARAFLRGGADERLVGARTLAELQALAASSAPKSGDAKSAGEKPTPVNADASPPTPVNADTSPPTPA